MKFPLLICFIILNNAFSAEVVGEAHFNKYGSDSEVQERLGRIGNEFGATTGRARRLNGRLNPQKRQKL